MQNIHRSTVLASLVLVLGAAACADLPSAPMEEEATPTAPQGTTASAGFQAALTAARSAPGGMLPTLDYAWKVALRAVAEAEGPEAAAAIQRRHRTLLAQAAEAGDEARARALLEEAHQLQLETVVYAFGERVAVRLHDVVGTRLRALVERLADAQAAGVDVAVEEELIRQAAELHQAAATALQAGQPTVALDADFAAAELLNQVAVRLG